MNFEIEKGVELTPVFARDTSRFPLLKMEVGDSFVVPKAQYPGLSSAIRRLKKKGLTNRYICRKISANEHRCWRME